MAAATAAPDAAPYHLRRLLRLEIERRTAQLLADICPLPFGRKPSSSHLSGTDGSDRSEVSGDTAEAEALSALALAVGEALEAPADTHPPAKKRRREVDEDGSRRRIGIGMASAQDADDGSDQLESGPGSRRLPVVAAASPHDSSLAAAEVEVGLDSVIARTFAALAPDALRRVLSEAAARTPRTVEALLLYALPPAAAELLTQKLERADEALLRAGKCDEQVHASMALRPCRIQSPAAGAPVCTALPAAGAACSASVAMQTPWSGASALHGKHVRHLMLITLVLQKLALVYLIRVLQVAGIILRAPLWGLPRPSSGTARDSASERGPRARHLRTVPC